MPKLGNIWIPGEKKHRFTHFPPISLQPGPLLTTPSPNAPSNSTKTSTKIDRTTTTYFPEEPLPTYVLPTSETLDQLPVQLRPTCTTEVFHMIQCRSFLHLAPIYILFPDMLASQSKQWPRSGETQRKDKHIFQ